MMMYSQIPAFPCADIRAEHRACGRFATKDPGQGLQQGHNGSYRGKGVFVVDHCRLRITHMLLQGVFLGRPMALETGLDFDRVGLNIEPITKYPSRL